MTKCYGVITAVVVINCAMIEMSSLSWWVVGSRDSHLAGGNGRVEVRTCPVGVRLSI